MFDYAKHKRILLQILKDIYTDTTISPYLGFKGGTAALLFYGLNRNSVDLDFDLLDDTKEKEVFEKIQKIATQYGTLETSRIKRFNLLNVISYAHGAQKIKIEINLRQFGSHYEIQHLLGISMLVMTKPDMFAHKLMVIFQRVGKTSRDIFDVYFFCKQGWEINKEIVEQRAQISFASLLSQCIIMLEKTDDRHMLDGLGELLSDSQKDWARAKLKSETIFFLKIMFENENSPR